MENDIRLEFQDVPGSPPDRDAGHEITVYALSTCGVCRRALEYLRNRGVPFRYTYIDHLGLERKTAVKRELAAKYHTRIAFPTLVIDDSTVVVGFYRKYWDTELDRLADIPENRL